MLELANGQQLADRYTLERRLGAGGEAQTWLASDRFTGALVALKIVANSGTNSERLRAEWQQQIRLMHAHIVRVFEFHSDDDLALYSQQFIDGPDLGALAGQPVGEILPVIGLIADALRYMHGKGVVHRDIKASNILLDQNGAPYLSDFGIAATEGERGSGGSMISQSPQSLAGDVAQPADDIFALGGLIYELVSGKPPYAAETLADDIRNKTPDPLRTVDGLAVPQDVAGLVANMLEKSSEARPTAEEVVERLRVAGFEPGTASIKGSAHAAVADERVETVATVQPVTAKPAQPEPLAPADY